MFKVRLISKTENPFETLIEAARICYDSYGKSSKENDVKLLENCFRNKHLSVFEHVSFTFKIEGISRACSHQIVRHRTAKISQRSQRFVNENNFECVIPDSIVGNYKAEKLFQETIKNDKYIYEEFLSLGIKKEDARAILPNACTTKLIFTCDLRNMFNFIELRLSKKAQAEIRDVAFCFGELVMREIPELKEVILKKLEEV